MKFEIEPKVVGVRTPFGSVSTCSLQERLTAWFFSIENELSLVL